MEFNNGISWEMITPFCLWGLWIKKNDNIFNDKNYHVQIDHIIAQTTEFKLIVAKSNRTKTIRMDVQVKRIFPSQGMLKLNVDGACTLMPARERVYLGITLVNM